MIKISKITNLLLISLILLTSCGAPKWLKPSKVDTRKTPVNAKDRALKNINEGKGIRLGDMNKSRGTSYEFSTSNPMWRASLEVLDFLPLSTVDYSGGIVITDWYSDANSKNDSIKITVRFLSNEIRSDSIKIIDHKKSCSVNNACNINQVDSKIQEELLASIIKKAALIDSIQRKKKK